MAWFRTGGGALSETVLWTNPSPTAAWTETVVTLSESISNYTGFRIYYKLNKDSDVILFLDCSKDFIKQSDAINGHSPLTMTGYQNGAYVRFVRYTSDTQITIGNTARAGASGGNNNLSIPFKICGLK